jgi:hypothetical protein
LVSMIARVTGTAFLKVYVCNYTACFARGWTETHIKIRRKSVQRLIHPVS